MLPIPASHWWQPVVCQLGKALLHIDEKGGKLLQDYIFWFTLSLQYQFISNLDKSHTAFDAFKPHFGFDNAALKTQDIATHAMNIVTGFRSTGPSGRQAFR